MASTASPMKSTFSEKDQEFRTDRAIACVALRMSLGLNIGLHGVTRTILGSLSGFVAFTMKQFESAPLPMWQVQAFAYVLPFVEMLLGLLLFFGIATRWALLAGSIVMIALEFGTALRSDWNLLMLQMFYSLLYFILLMCREWDTMSVMNFFGLKK